MSFLDQYKQRLLDKVEVTTEKGPQGPIMHRALVDVVTEQTERQQELQELIIETFGWDAASTPSECSDIWNDALTEKDWTGSDGREQAAQPQRDVLKRVPKKNEMVIMQNGVGQIVDINAGNGNITVRNQQGVEKLFPQDQLIGPKQLNGKPSWALKTAMARE